MKTKKGKKAQITIFVIIALILVVSIALIFSITKGPFTKVRPQDDPQAYIEQCVQPVIDQAAAEIIKNGGYVDASSANHNILYDDRKIAYLCYSSGAEQICVNEEPVLMSHIEKEIESYIGSDIEACFNSLEKSFGNYDYQASPTSFEVEILPNQILVNIEKEITIQKDTEVISLSAFNTAVNHPMNDFIVLAIKIINQEVKCDCGRKVCNADIIDLVRKNRDYEIEKFMSARSEEIYTIREVISDKEFVFAIRNCIRLP